MASPKMIIKLLVDKKGQRVMFAETSKDFVDFIFHIFSLPLGTLIELIGSKQMVGCLGNLKDSIDSFNETYLQPGIKKDDIFNPKTPYIGNTLLLSYDAPFGDQSHASKPIYRCPSYSAKTGPIFCDYSNCLSYVTLSVNAKCPNCSRFMSATTTPVFSKEEATAEIDAAAIKKKMKGDYVRKVVTYMVMDDLVVKPMSTISSITLINSFGVSDLSQLEEKMVSFGKDEALKLLKASLTTEKVLTTLFMADNHA